MRKNNFGWIVVIIVAVIGLVSNVALKGKKVGD